MSDESKVNHVEMTPARAIWDSISKKMINVFSQEVPVDFYFSFSNIDSNQCYLVAKVGAAIPALEAILPPELELVQGTKFILIKKNESF